MNLLNFLNIQSTWNLHALKGERLKEILNEILSSELDGIELTEWDKNYQWSGEFNEHGVKHVLEFITLKDNKATIHFGNVYNFIPVLSSDGKILSKSKRLQLYERIDGWYKSYQEKPSNQHEISLWNEYFFNKSIKQVLAIEKNNILQWFSKNETLEQNIQTSIIQIEKAGSYKRHKPDQKFILAFLLAKNGEKEVALDILKDFYKPLINKKPSSQKVFDKMQKLIAKL